MPMPLVPNEKFVVPVPADCVKSAPVATVELNDTSAALLIVIDCGACVLPTALANVTFPVPALTASWRLLVAPSSFSGRENETFPTPPMHEIPLLITGAAEERWCEEPPPPLLVTGIAQFNRGEYFEQHETLEELWHAEARPVRRLYQGILQIGVALYHVRRGNHHGAVYMLGRGSMYLRPFAPTCQGLDVAALLQGAAATLAIVDTLGPARLDEFEWDRAPTVRLC
jgi:hypothetical protein